MDKIKFDNLDEARMVTLITMYEKLNDLPFGTDEFLNGAQSISQLEKHLSERERADSDYAAKVKVAELDMEIRRELAQVESNTKKDIASIDSETRLLISEKDLEQKEKIAQVEIDTKRDIAQVEIDSKIKLSEEDLKLKKSIADSENYETEQNRKSEKRVKLIEVGAKTLLVGAQLFVFMEELGKSRKFEETGVEVTSAFRKLWSGFKPFSN